MKVKDEDITFALKIIKKKHVVDNRQEEHIHSERRILAEARSPFIVKSVPISIFLICMMNLCSISLGKQRPPLLGFDEIAIEDCIFSVGSNSRRYSDTCSEMSLFPMNYHNGSFSLPFVRLWWSNFAVCSGTGWDIKAITHLPPSNILFIRCMYLFYLTSASRTDVIWGRAPEGGDSPVEWLTSALQSQIPLRPLLNLRIGRSRCLRSTFVIWCHKTTSDLCFWFINPELQTVTANTEAEFVHLRRLCLLFVWSSVTNSRGLIRVC